MRYTNLINRRSKAVLIFLSFLSLSILSLLLFLNNFYSLTKENLRQKEEFVKVTAMPDLAISTEAMYIRHRSLANTFSIFKESPELREYFPTTFVFSHSHIQKNQTIEAKSEK